MVIAAKYWSVVLTLCGAISSANGLSSMHVDEIQAWCRAEMAELDGAYPSVRSRVRNLRKPSAAVRRDGRGGRRIGGSPRESCSVLVDFMA
jgi:hypothetical protein